MALPPELVNDKVISIAKALRGMSSEQLASFPSLYGSDFRAFGKIIQCFSFIDLHLRRALEIFYLADCMPVKWEKGYPAFRDSELTQALNDILRTLSPRAQDLDTALAWLQVIDKCRGHRNLAGHAAARRFPNADVFVFANKNPGDAKRANLNLPNHGFQATVVGRSEFFDMVQTARESEASLGDQVPEWDTSYRRVRA